MITREQIVECARGYLNTPFRHQGRLKGIGVDCIGLVVAVGRDLGIVEATTCDRLDYEEQAISDLVLRMFKKVCVEIPADQIKAGDILCLCVPVPTHAAIVTDLMGNVGMIHAYQPTNMVVEHNLDLYWRQRIAGAFKYPGVVD